MFPYVFMPVINLWRWMVTGSHAVWARGVVVMADSADSSDLEMFHHSVSWVIHATGLWFDLGVGWLLLTPGRARHIGMFLCLSFHLMTTQMFSIGMFPYMSIALLTVWLPPDWPHLLAAGTLGCFSNTLRRIHLVFSDKKSMRVVENESAKTSNSNATKPTAVVFAYY